MDNIKDIKITFNKIANGHYESSDGKYIIRHATGYKAKYSTKPYTDSYYKYDYWEVTDKTKFLRGDIGYFKTLKDAKRYICTKLY